MKNKEIQEKRMRDYFIQATREILKGEGIESISVRNIADRAGYSYATLYNYFRDINDLIFLCVTDFQEECKKFAEEQTQKSEKGISKLKNTVVAYIHYFVEYPGIFDLFYLTKAGSLVHKPSTLNTIGTSLDNVCEEEWQYCISQNLFSAEEAEKRKEQLRFLVAGMLLFFLNRRIPGTYDSFISQVNFQIEQILK
jgi:AcrR family transcriptional regulator